MMNGMDGGTMWSMARTFGAGVGSCGTYQIPILRQATRPLIGVYESAAPTCRYNQR